MSGKQQDYRTVKFLGRLEGNNHLVILYDEQKYADLIISCYLQDGLEKGESCIFFAPVEPEKIEARLSERGIDVDSYKKKNSLRIFHIEKSDANKLDALSTLQGMREQAVRGMKPPYRFVGRTKTDTATIEGVKWEMTVEKTGHEHFAEFDNSQLCYYEISWIEKSMRNEWIRGLLKNHHLVIYPSEHDRAVAFETAPLEEVDAE